MALQHNYPLQSLNTFGIQAQAEYFTAFHSIDELQQILEQARPPLMV